MPTYQYACTECGHGFETVQSFSDDALTECPQCTGRLRKVFNSVGIVFKGSGFYRTDSREKPKDDAATSGSGSKDGAGSSTTESTKADAKSSTAGSSSGGSGSTSGSASGGSSSSGSSSSSSGSSSSGSSSSGSSSAGSSSSGLSGSSKTGSAA